MKFSSQYKHSGVNIMYLNQSSFIVLNLNKNDWILFIIYYYYLLLLFIIIIYYYYLLLYCSFIRRQSVPPKLCRSQRKARSPFWPKELYPSKNFTIQFQFDVRNSNIQIAKSFQ